jgi:hypothetical protein
MRCTAAPGNFDTIDFAETLLLVARQQLSGRLQVRLQGPHPLPIRSPLQKSVASL